MREDALDRRLTEAFHEHFGVARRQEDALWESFTARLKSQAQAWAFLMVALVRTQARVRPAVIRSSWAARVR